MMSEVAKRLAELGLEIPRPVAPVANYVPFVVSGRELFISGQVSMGPNGLVTGKLGAGMTIEDGIAAAELCGVNLIAQMNAALDGDLDRVRRIVKLGGFVNCTPDFTDQPKVINGASDLMVAVFGDAGRHARAAVGAPSLPLGAAVEVDAIVEIA
ncbi:MAG: RidA family protein [Parvularculaceae bacterium]|nr:RidA family protein [Parvularculaceae bacterium]